MTKRMWATLLVITLMLAAFPTSMAFAGTRTTRCNLRLRATTSTESETLVVIPGGTEINVLGTSGGWTKTSYNGHTGYISTSYLMDLTRSGYYPLKEGDESSFVKDLQNRLSALGFYTGTIDGKYQASTTQAVTAFQKANNIGADGLAGGETQRILYGDTAMGTTTNVLTTEPTANTQTTVTTTTTSTGVASSKTLRMGDRGEEVKTLQARLIELGYLSGRADGIFGAATHKAVVDFQKRSSLTADGKAGQATQGVLFSTSAKDATGTVANNTTTDTTTTVDPANYKTLKRGMTSNEVKNLQTKLRELGYMTANATGYFGTATLAAVESFQRSNSLTADGIAGPATQAKLFGTSANSATTDTTTTNPTTYATLKQGMKSAAVTTMQKKLRELGYMTANATGYFGTATKAAVIAFQKQNNLSADGVAGTATLSRLFDGTASASSSGSSGSATVATSEGTGKMSGPSKSSIKLLHWFNSVKPSLKTGSTLQVYDPSTGYAWKLKAMSLGRHADSEPLTAEDTYFMNQAFGNKTTWNPKIVYIKLPSGTWTMATMHNTPHLSGTISSNNFDGHLCVHFLRDMDEVTKNDPNYGVQNQKALRDGWKALTGEVIN